MNKQNRESLATVYIYTHTQANLINKKVNISTDVNIFIFNIQK